MTRLAQPFQLCPAPDGVSDEEVGRCGLKHDFGFRGLGHGQAHGAQIQLPAAERGNLMGLGVGPEPQAVLTGISGHAREVALHDVEIDNERGRI